MKKGWDIEKIDLTPPEAPKPDEVPKGRMQRLRVAGEKTLAENLTDRGLPVCGFRYFRNAEYRILHRR